MPNPQISLLLYSPLMQLEISSSIVSEPGIVEFLKKNPQTISSVHVLFVKPKDKNSQDVTPYVLLVKDKDKDKDKDNDNCHSDIVGLAQKFRSILHSVQNAISKKTDEIIQLFDNEENELSLTDNEKSKHSEKKAKFTLSTEDLPANAYLAEEEIWNEAETDFVKHYYLTIVLNNAQICNLSEKLKTTDASGKFLWLPVNKIKNTEEFDIKSLENNDYKIKHKVNFYKTLLNYNYPDINLEESVVKVAGGVTRDQEPAE